MSKGTWILLVAMLFVTISQSKLIDEYWRTTYIQNTMTLTMGNHTSWKCLHCCADNNTVRPANETKLINYVNDTWCKGNATCMSFFPRADVSFAYYSDAHVSTNGQIVPPTNAYFWIWVLKSTFRTRSPRYMWCNQDYFPRWDWWYLCQAFMPSASNSWFYGIRWYCGSNNPYGACWNDIKYKLPVGKPPFFNMTGLAVGTGEFLIPCCYPYGVITTVYVF